MVYWLGVQADNNPNTMVGWKSSLVHWNDDAGFYIGTEPWHELRYPLHPELPETVWGDSIDLVFTITTIPEPGSFAVIAGLSALGFAAWRRFKKT